jgi:nitroreductase
MKFANNPHRLLVDAIEKRISANYFDSSHVLPDSDLTEIIRLATLAASISGR